MRFSFAAKRKEKFVSRDWYLLWVLAMCACLALSPAACTLKKGNFWVFLPPGNPGLAKAENVLSQNHVQLHQKPEKVSHPGQIAVGSFKSTDIFYLSIVFSEGSVCAGSSVLVCEFAVTHESRVWVRLRGVWGWLKLTALSLGLTCVQLKSPAECPVLAQVTFLCEIPICDGPTEPDQLPSKAFFGVEVTITVYAVTVKYSRCCLTVGSSAQFSLLRVQDPLPRWRTVPAPC